MSLRELTPWYMKMAAKVVLSRVPISYRAWQSLHIFSHGAMDRASYAYQVFRQHYDRCNFPRKDAGFVALEIGPGDGLLSAVIASAFGASRCYLVDTGSYAVTDPAPYREAADLLHGLGLRPPDLTTAPDVAAVLERCNAVYLTGGLSSLKQVPSESVDFAWSHAVLEHVRRHEFADTCRELRRVLVHDGCSSHQVDLKDHLGGGLNNLRLSSRWWEAEWMARSGFYTNRLRFAEMMRVFAGQHFAVDTIATQRFASLPISRAALAREFGNLADEDLMISGFHAVLRPQ